MAEAKGRPGTKASADRIASIASKTRRLYDLDKVKTFVYSPDGDNRGRDSLNHAEVLKLVGNFVQTKPVIRARGSYRGFPGHPFWADKAVRQLRFRRGPLWHASGREGARISPRDGCHGRRGGARVHVQVRKTVRRQYSRRRDHCIHSPIVLRDLQPRAAGLGPRCLHGRPGPGTPTSTSARLVRIFRSPSRIISRR